MPKDQNGKELEVGNKVTVEFEVINLSSEEQSGNTTLKTASRVGPNNYYPEITLNSAQCVFQEPPPPEEDATATKKIKAPFEHEHEEAARKHSEHEQAAEKHISKKH